MEALIVSLVLAAVSGLSWIAYRHPKGYRRIVGTAGPAVLVLLVLASIWLLGGLMSAANLLHEALQENPTADLQSERYAIESMANTWRTIRFAFSTAFASGAFLAFLWFLPQLLDLRGPEAEDPDAASR